MLKSVMYMLSGGMLAQLISLVSVVLLARFYSPGDFGIFGAFSSFVLILTSCICLKFDVAMIVRKGNGRAGLLFHASWISILLIFLIVSIIVLVARTHINIWFQADFSFIEVFSLPLTVLLVGLVLLFSQVLVRKRKFRAFSMMRVCQSATTGVMQLLLSSMSAMGLIAGYILGLFMALLVMVKPVFSERFFIHSRRSRVFEEIRQTAKFSSISSITGLINVIGLQLPLVLCTFFFGPTATGLYALSLRVLALPTNLIGTTMGQTYLAEIRRPEKQPHINQMTVDIYCLLISLGTAPAIFLAMYGGDLFSLTFGTEWYDAGLIAAWHAPWVISSIVVTVLLQVFFAREKTLPVFLYTTLFSSARITTFLGIYYYDGSFMDALIGLSASGTVVNIFIIVWALMETGNNISTILRKTIGELWMPGLSIFPLYMLQLFFGDQSNLSAKMFIAVFVMLTFLGASMMIKARGRNKCVE